MNVSKLSLKGQRSKYADIYKRTYCAHTEDVKKPEDDDDDNAEQEENKRVRFSEEVRGGMFMRDRGFKTANDLRSEEMYEKMRIRVENDAEAIRLLEIKEREEKEAKEKREQELIEAELAERQAALSKIGIEPPEFFAGENEQYKTQATLEELKRQSFEFAVCKEDVEHDTANLLYTAIWKAFQNDLRGANSPYIPFERWSGIICDTYVEHAQMEEKETEKIPIKSKYTAEQEQVKLDNPSYYYVLMQQHQNVCRRLFRSRPDPIFTDTFEISEGLQPRFYRLMDKLTVKTRYMKYYGRRAFHTHFVHKFPNLREVLELIKTIHQQAMDEEDIAQEALARMEKDLQEKKRLEQSNALIVITTSSREPPPPKADAPEKKPVSVIKPFVDLRDTDVNVTLHIANPHVTLNTKRIIDMDYTHTIALTDYRPIVFDAVDLHEHTALTLQERDALMVYDYDTTEMLFCIFRKFRDAMNMMYLYTGNKSIQAIERVECEHPKKRNKSQRKYRFTDNIDYNLYASLPKMPEPQRPFFASARRRLSTHIESSCIFGEQFSQISFMCHRFFMNVYHPTWYMFSEDEQDQEDDDEKDDDENNHNNNNNNNNNKPEKQPSDEPTDDDLLRYSVAQKIQWIEMFSTYYAGAYYISAGHTSAGLMLLDRVTPMFNKYFEDSNPEIALLHQIELLYFSLMRPLEYRLSKRTYRTVKALIEEDKLQERRMKWTTFLTKCQNQLVKNRHIYYQLHEKENEFINSVRPVDNLQRRMFLDGDMSVSVYDKVRVEDKISLLSAVIEANPSWNGAFYSPRKRVFPDELSYAQRSFILCEDVK